MNGWHQIVGHEWAVAHLRAAIAHGRLGHAMLITGPDQIGKTLLARTVAQALNCLAPDEAERPCGTCRACTLIAADKHPDVRMLAPEVTGRGKMQLKIDAVRELAQELNLAPYEARVRVAILRRFDTANVNAANAFLKTLEEPPERVVLILTALDAASMLPTIASRCRQLPLRPLAPQDIREALVERWAASARQAENLAHLADGRLGLAVGILKDPTLLEERERDLARLVAALRADLVGRFSIAGDLTNDAEALPGLLQTWATWWRDLALVAWRQPDQLVNWDHKESLTALSRRWQPTAIAEALEATQTALDQLAANANTRLVMENLLLSYPTAPPAQEPN